MRIEFTAKVFRENDQFVSHAPELDVSSCGATPEEARANLDEAVRLFLEAAADSNDLEALLEDCGYTRGSDQGWKPPQPLFAESAAVHLPEHAQT
ncbi:MAG: type II toxin-antitoxin system HicB family antitoxin [Bryobacterales bacterium]